MSSLLSYCCVAAFVAVTVAAPNPAIGHMIDVVNHKPSKTLSSPLITSSSIVIRGVLSAKNKAAGPLINDGVDNGRKAHSTHSVLPFSQSSSSYSSSNSTTFGTLVVPLCDSSITLAPRHPAVGPIDFGNQFRVTRATSLSGLSTSTTNADSECPFIAALGETQPSLLPRGPAVNIINAVGDGAPNESVISLAGGSPVTLAGSDLDELNAVAYVRDPSCVAQDPSLTLPPALKYLFPLRPSHPSTQSSALPHRQPTACPLLSTTSRSPRTQVLPSMSQVPARSFTSIPILDSPSISSPWAKSSPKQCPS